MITNSMYCKSFFGLGRSFTRLRFLVLVVLLMGACRELASGQQPNFLIIVTDDQRYETFTSEFMPLTKTMIADEGVLFERAYVTTPMCCPSRSSIFTGMYASHHEVLQNYIGLNKKTVADRLHQAGYYTGLVGKYLNSWNGSPRPEFDFWVAIEGWGSNYFNPRLNVNGQWLQIPGYMTYILKDHVLEFLTNAPKDRPFLLFFTPNAPHRPFEPATEDAQKYLNLAPFRPPNFNPADVSGKPQWVQQLPLLNSAKIQEVGNDRRFQLQMLSSVDRAIGEILDLLKMQQRLDDTLVIFLSDNGTYWGEHRIQSGKGSAYEPALRVPFALRYPPLVRGPKIETRLVANIDIAPTLYELAGLPMPRTLNGLPEVDGLSLVPLLRGTNQWRDALMIEDWSSLDVPATFAGIYTGRLVYIETEGDRSELYDLGDDPYQLQNLTDLPIYAGITQQVRERLEMEKQIVMQKVSKASTVNGAGFQPGVPVSPGSLASSFWVGPVSSTLGDVTLQMNDIAAPLLAVSPNQIDFQVPWEMLGRLQATFTVSVGGVARTLETIPITPVNPGLFSADGSGSGQGAILIANTAFLAAPAGMFSGSRPANRGEAISIYCTGLGLVVNIPPTGALAPANPLSPVTRTTTVTIGGVSAQVTFSGLAPGFFGLYQVNAVVPPNAPTGNAVPVTLSLGGATSNTVTIAVQ